MYVWLEHDGVAATLNVVAPNVYTWDWDGGKVVVFAFAENIYITKLDVTRYLAWLFLTQKLKALEAEADTMDDVEGGEQPNRRW